VVAAPGFLMAETAVSVRAGSDRREALVALSPDRNASTVVVGLFDMASGAQLEGVLLVFSDGRISSWPVQRLTASR